MSAPVPGPVWQVRLFKPLFGLRQQPQRPAEVSHLLCEVMLARENLLEDVDYQKIVPNHFVVELPPENYLRHYQPIAARICQQWNERLLSHLTTTNSRQGRREYHFAGQVSVEVRPAADLEMGQIRILSRLQPDLPTPQQPHLTLPACLTLPTGQQWRLRAGLMTIGRDAACDIFLDLPLVQERRLVSSAHAYVQCAPGTYRVFDGTPQGHPSVNGTFVNHQRVPPNGQLLRDGDTLILAALQPQAPQLDTPGVAVLHFQLNCE